MTHIGWIKWLTSVTLMMAQSWPWDWQISDKKSLTVYVWQDKNTHIVASPLWYVSSLTFLLLPNFSTFRLKEIVSKKKKKKNRKISSKVKFILENSLHTADFTDFILEFIWKSVWCYQRINSKQHQPISVNSIQPVIELIPDNFQLSEF